MKEITINIPFCASPEPLKKPQSAVKGESTADTYSSSQYDFCLQILPVIKPQTLYCDEILQHLLRQEERFKVSAEGVLRNCGISVSTRAKIIDWVVEVVYKAECSKQTLFLTIALIDRFLQNSIVSYKDSDIQLIGVVAMLLASKLIDTESLDIDFMYEQAVHKKISKKTMQDFETEMLKVLKFYVSTPTELDFLDVYWEKLGEKQQNVLSQAQYIASLNLYSITIASIKPSTRAAATLALACKESANSSQETATLANIAGIGMKELAETIGKIEEHREEFKKLYPKLKNVFTYYKCYVD
eukprot:TRINITY_DN4000_c0_g2_i1.p1 TRINITY_DN4000_c0_g2~~TRINITY_DN4000_c0_g2_i1.p1  ORF type:complete len:300 (-),score=36.88 TRINITY_DN4000_c0_g2_i1:158-1057(-)